MEKYGVVRPDDQPKPEEREGLNDGEDRSEQRPLDDDDK